MADSPDIAAKATADTTQFVAAFAQATEVVKRLSETVRAGGPPLSSLGRNIQEAIAPVDRYISKLNDLETALKSVQANAGRLGEGQSTALLQNISSQGITALKSLDEQTKKISGSMGGLSIATSGAVREFIVMGHEIGMGNWSRLAGSIPVLAERMAGLQYIFGMLSGASWAVTAGIAATASALAYIGWQAYEAGASVTETTGHLQMLGQGLEFTREKVALWRQELADRFQESSSSVKVLTEYTDKLGPSFTRQTPAVRNLVEALSGIKGINLGEAVEEFEKQFGTTAESFNKAAEAMGVLTPLEEEHVQELIKMKEEATANSTTLPALSAAWGKEGEAVRDATIKLQDYITTASDMEGMGLPAGEIPDTTHLRPDPSRMRPTISPEERAGQAAVVAQSKEFEHQIALREQLRTATALEAGMLQHLTDISGGAADKDNRRLDIAKDLLQTQAALASIQIQIPLAKRPEEINAFEKQMADFDRQEKAAGDNKERIDKIAQERLAVQNTYYGEGTIGAIKAAEKATEATRAYANQDVQIYTDGIRQKQAAARHDQDEQVRLQQELIQHLKGLEGGNYANTHVQEMQQAQTRLQELTQSAADANYQRFAASSREMVQAAQGDFAKIGSIYQAWAERARAQFGAVSTEFQDVQRDMVRAAQEGVKKAFEGQERAAEAAQHADTAYLSAFKARMEEQVRTHKMTEQQALGFDIEYTGQLYTQLYAQQEAIKTSADAATEIHQKAIDKQIELKAEYNKIITQDQEKIAEAAEKSSKAVHDAFAKAFDGIGSSLEKGITDALTGQRSTTPIATQIAKGLIGDVTHFGGTLLSQYAGKGLASLTNTSSTDKEGNQKGLGDVLSTWVTKLVGLAPLEDKNKDTIQKSQADLKSTIDKSGEYTKDLTTAIKGLTDKISTAKSISGGVTSPTLPGMHGGHVSKETAQSEAAQTGATGAAQNALAYALTSQGEKLKDYCAKLVNDSLTAAGVKGSGSDLASSWKTTGKPVAPEDVRAGDVFYAPPSGRGDTGHVGMTMGPIQAGTVQVISSHLQGADSNPAGIESRSAANLTFRRPDYPGGGGDVSSQIAQLSSSITTSAQVQQQATTAVSQDKQATEQNTAALKQPQKSAPAGGGGGGGADSPSTTSGISQTVSGFQGLASTLGQVVPAFKILSGTIGAVTSVFHGISSITQGVSSLAGTASAVSTTAAIATQTGTLVASQATSTAAIVSAITTSAAVQAAVPKPLGFSGGGIVPSAFEGSVIPSAAGGHLIGSHHHRMHIPSAAGGMTVNDGLGGQLMIGHPQEMMLPADISRGMQNLIRNGGAGSTTNNSSGGNHTFNYAPQISGRFGSGFSSSEVSGMLRAHSGEFEGYARNMVRNGFRG